MKVQLKAHLRKGKQGKAINYDIVVNHEFKLSASAGVQILSLFIPSGSESGSL